MCHAIPCILRERPTKHEHTRPWWSGDTRVLALRCVYTCDRNASAVVVSRSSNVLSIYPVHVVTGPTIHAWAGSFGLDLLDGQHHHRFPVCCWVVRPVRGL